jgi:hypothetical protein
VLNQTYGALADLRRELADSKTKVAERADLLATFAQCADSQRAWLLLEDYFERHSLSRKDFPGQEWWPRLLNARGKDRLEELAILFIRAARPIPTELASYANMSRFAEIEASEQEQNLIAQIEAWLAPPAPVHLDAPRASLRVVCHPEPLNDPGVHTLRIEFQLCRPRTGERPRSIAELVELPTRATHEEEQFSPPDWEFIQWLTEHYGASTGKQATALRVQGTELLQWLARWGNQQRLELAGVGQPLGFHGQLAELTPHIENGTSELSLTHRFILPHNGAPAMEPAHLFAGNPSLVLLGTTFFLVRNAPSPALLGAWLQRPRLPVKRLGPRLLTALRKSGSHAGVEWQQLCITHTAVPQFVFELVEESVRLRLLARSERDKSLWHWTGHEWQPENADRRGNGKPEVLEDPRLVPATQWLRRLDWFTPEPGLWIGDATEAFLSSIAGAWADRPKDAEFLGDAAFQRLFLAPRRLRPNLVVKGSGIDWFSVSAEWEQEGLRLTPADLQRLASATGRFVKLPDSGWVELDTQAVRSAHEAMADLGVDGLAPVAQRLELAQAAHMDDAALGRFGDSPHARALRERLRDFEAIPATVLPETVRAELRPYQREGFHFLCHLSNLKLGGVLADDMGLGKTLQTLSWIAWLHQDRSRPRRPALVICPASVLHNWRREAERFTPHLKVLVLESGAARHNLRKQIPQHDIIVTNYALLRRDLEALQKFQFRVVVLDEAQFIKNPTAQVTQCVKQLESELRLALTGTPLENRLLDLWSIVDFVQPTYLGTQDHFTETYDLRGDSEEAVALQRIARRRLSAKLRPLLMRRLKKQVAKDLPDRIEQRWDCELGESQRKLYLAELRRSREQVMKTVAEKGLKKSQIHVLAALTRLRQTCCHPRLVGNDAASGKTDTLFELLEPLLDEGQKVLVFSQFVQMLKLLEEECGKRQIPTHILTGETKNRQETVNAFQQDPQAGVFLLSLRAAGTGLNLTKASYVVLYDPWWNPAVEAQAIDRSHRIGQTQTVNAYRLIAPGTVEEKIWELQQQKAKTIADVLGEEGFARSLSQTDLEYLFAEDG